MPIGARRGLTRPLVAIVVALLIAGAAAWEVAAVWATGHAVADADQEAVEEARGDLGLLSSELQKFRLLPLVLADTPDVLAALEHGSPDSLQAVNERLELLVRRTDAAAIYLIAPSGRTLAASNWRLPTSFVGQNYGFRPYFRDALRGGAAELFALGTVSGRPGLFLARRIGTAARPLGVIVVKVEFDRIEHGWASRRDHSLVLDRQGVILITSDPSWRFTMTRPLGAAAMDEVRRSLQFGTRPLRSAPVTIAGDTATIADEPRARYRLARLPVPLAGATLIHLEPLGPPLAAAAATARLWALAVLIALTAVAVLVWRGRERRLLQEEARRALKEEVAHRTAELREVNAALVERSRERIEADARYRAAREELAQASRLASLGQITAGVAHEINQPVAAIRTFAESATLLLDRGEAPRVDGNLRQIVSLTERIGTITAELRGFARRRTPEVDAVALAAVIDGAMLLAGDKVRELVRLDLPAAVATLRVRGDKVRLEQIVLNLLQNAADAVAAVPAPAITLAVREGDGVLLTVADNGGGVDPAIADQIFTPFVSGKPDGLGLGLGIARDIAREFGGTLDWAPTAGGGAVFQLRLRST